MLVDKNWTAGENENANGNWKVRQRLGTPLVKYILTGVALIFMVVYMKTPLNDEHGADTTQWLQRKLVKEARVESQQELPRLGIRRDIKDGTAAGNNAWASWPHLVVVDTGGGWCGGGLLSKRKVVTAAHCCGGANNNAHTHIYHGPFPISENRKIRGDVVKYPSYEYNRIWANGAHNQGGRQNSPINDLCVVTTREDVPVPNGARAYPKIVNPNLFPTNGIYGKDVHFAGWGRNNENGGTGTLRVALNMKIECCMTQNAFEWKTNAADLLKRYKDPYNQFLCAKKNANNQFPCTGDSGSPLWSTDKSQIYGVLVDIKWRTCTTGPAWFTNFYNAPYYRWVNEQVYK